MKTDKAGSHLPLLKKIANKKHICRVIEFGSGYFSTGCFLDKNIFKYLEILVSFESQKEWYDKVYSRLKEERLVLIHKNEQESLDLSLQYAPVDLVFVDGKSGKMRVPTALYSKKLSNITVLHDANDNDYKEAISSFRYKYIYKKIKPHTAVLSDSDNLLWL